MILADKIIEERKRNAWSQEQLAEKLEVSRQSVSKWESAQSIPDINRIIQMAAIFGVSTDYLLKDDYPKEESGKLVESHDEQGPKRFVTLSEAQDYLNQVQIDSPKVALASSLSVLSPIALLALSGMAENKLMGLSEGIAGAIGIGVLLIFVAIAVSIFISSDNHLKKFDYLEKEAIDTEYGVEGLVRKLQNEFDSRHQRQIVIGVILCILGVIPLVMSSFLTQDDLIIILMVCLLLSIVSIAVNLFVKNSMIASSYQKLLEEGDFSLAKKKSSILISRVASIYWLSATVIYLGWSFITNSWGMTWIIWPIAGILFVIVMTITKIVIKAED
ncbi:transcriptional regulator [Streptococcus bovimastitidis]|uniref:Transcriptional regulator n=1 Tax=Streptococcus bovimastitidis TaxID=1856638 RepID=A0A1L8MN92_9STRE|nr:helix-turn-helix transcriptional regulator [Streptococcus bovimastitidis]OJF72211.1 transcriptional regulator [Streptococcus bovimastitidis]